MARLMDAAANRVAPWRGADRRVLVVEGVALILAGGYLLADAAGLLGLTAWLAIGSGIVIGVVGLRQRLTSQSPAGSSAAGQPPT